MVMRSKECIAMLLAGGQGNRLGLLTKNVAKPAVPFGGKYRIIDFTLSNCTNSGIDTVGVLTQYRPLKLNTYIGSGQPWDLDIQGGGVSVLPPFVKGKVGEWYKGTASAIFQNIEFIEQYNPQYVVILSGDHIYKMDYSELISYHKGKKADATIAVIQVPWEEASRFGIMNTESDGRIYEFEEKPRVPKSNKASMGIYVFNWEILRRYLIEDDLDPRSSNDFGKNIIPKMLANGIKLFSYPFNGYWKDVGTIQSLWEANMDLLEIPPKFDIGNHGWKIYCRNPIEPPHYIASLSSVKRSIIGTGAMVYGNIEHSVISSGVYVGRGTVIKDSIIMPNTHIGENTRINCTIVSENAEIGDNCCIGYDEPVEGNDGLQGPYPSGIVIIGEMARIPSGTIINKCFHDDGTFTGMVAVEVMENKDKEAKAL